VTKRVADACAEITQTDWNPMSSDQIRAIKQALGNGQKSGHRWLRLPAGLETGFRHDYEREASGSRLLLFAVATLLIGCTFLYDGWLLGMPQPLRVLTHWIQFAIMIPSVALATLVTLAPRLRRFSAPAVVLASVTCTAGLIAQLSLGHKYGFSVPPQFPLFVVGVTFIIARLRFYYFLPWAVLSVAAAIIADVTVNGASGPEYYEVVASLMLFALTGLAGYLFEYHARTSWLQNRLLQLLSNLDALTDLANRRGFDCVFAELTRHAAREHKTLTVVMLDLDYFKDCNDHHGHEVGDACLRAVGKCLNQALRRPLDLGGRLGGEEFCVVWFDTNHADAVKMAEQLRVAIGRTCAQVIGCIGIGVPTASAGCFHAYPEPGTDPAALLREADRLLYAAKRSGRNQLQIGTVPTTQNGSSLQKRQA